MSSSLPAKFWVLTVVNVAVAAGTVGFFMARAGTQGNSTSNTTLPYTVPTIDREAQADSEARTACKAGWGSDEAVQHSAEAARLSARWQTLYNATNDAWHLEVQTRAIQAGTPGLLLKLDQLSDDERKALGDLGTKGLIIQKECYKVS